MRVVPGYIRLSNTLFFSFKHIKTYNREEYYKMKTLIVVDMQNDFVSPLGSLTVPKGEELIEPISKLMQDPDRDWHRIVVTRDWHPARHVSFAKNHKDKEPFSTYTYRSPRPGDDSTQEGILWPVHCVKNTWGSQLVDHIMDQVLTKHMKIVDKGFLTDREYYSAFNDIWNFHKTDMNKYLEKHHTDEVYIVGVSLEYCVKATAISAAELGYKTTVLLDYTRPISEDPEVVNKAIEELKAHNVNVVGK